MQLSSGYQSYTFLHEFGLQKHGPARRHFPSSSERIQIVRYPGGKQRILKYILPLIPATKWKIGKFIEPFAGGASVFFALRPERAVLSDINPELIDLYRGIRSYPSKVWQHYYTFPSTKEFYYQLRSMRIEGQHIALRAARTLYLNRTCFKGMWRHNSDGLFNVGYGGQARRWVVDEHALAIASSLLKKAALHCSDFEEIINSSQRGDFLFLDPPYCPGKRELLNAFYSYGAFSFEDHTRLAKCLHRATERGVNWLLTTSAHQDICSLFSGCRKSRLPVGTGAKPGVLTSDSNELLVRNY